MDAKSAKAVWPVLGSALLLGAAALRHVFKGPIRTQPTVAKPAAAAAAAGGADTKAGAGGGADTKAIAAKKPADIRIIPMRTEHIAAAARVCEDAFNGFAEHMRAPIEFHPGVAAAVFTAGVSAAERGLAYLVVAVDANDNDRVVGSNMIDVSDGIGSIGPISVDPAGARQLGGVGRLLMQSVIDWCLKVKGIKDIRLCAICDNKVSWSLYTKMGFVSPFHSADFGGLHTSKLLTMPVSPGLTVRDMTDADIPACDALVKRITPDHVQGRAHGIADAAHSSWARLVVIDEKQQNAIVGFTTGFRIDGFTYALHQRAVQSLLCEYARRIAKLNPHYELVFHVPVKLYPELLRWCLLEGGLKVARQIAMMQLDLTAQGGPAWSDPKVDQGIYLHNISY